jgi:hypothetical protein
MTISSVIILREAKVLPTQPCRFDDRLAFVRVNWNTEREGFEFT